MMAAFLLLTIYAANRSVTDRRTGVWPAVAVLSCALGMLCKETMAVAHPSYGSKIDLRTAGVPIQFSGARTGFDKALPVHIGEHNADIYRDLLGYSEEKLAALTAAGVI